MTVQSFAKLLTLANSQVRPNDKKWFPRWIARYGQFLQAPSHAALAVDRDLVIGFLLMLKAITPLLPNLEIHVLAEGWYHPDLGIVIEQRPLEDFLV